MVRATPQLRSAVTTLDTDLQATERDTLMTAIGGRATYNTVFGDFILSRGLASNFTSLGPVALPVIQTPGRGASWNALGLVPPATMLPAGSERAADAPGVWIEGNIGWLPGL